MQVTIHPATAALLDAEAAGGAALARRLGVAAPSCWPPEHGGAEQRAWSRRMLAAHPAESGFLGWYVVGEGRLAGICGFKGPPDAAGEVETGYSILAPLQRRGFATAALRLLLDHAFADARTAAVAAETLPHLAASRIVLDRCGFRHIATRTDPGHGEILRYRCPRA